MDETDKPKVKMIGEDGNVFAIMGKVCKALKRAGMPDKAKEFQKKAMKSKSYDAVLQLCFDYCEPY